MEGMGKKGAEWLKAEKAIAARIAKVVGDKVNNPPKKVKKKEKGKGK